MQAMLMLDLVCFAQMFQVKEQAGDPQGSGFT